MSGTYLPSDTRQRIQDLIKDSSITQAELAGIIGSQIVSLYTYPTIWFKNYHIVVKAYFQVFSRIGNYIACNIQIRW